MPRTTDKATDPKVIDYLAKALPLHEDETILWYRKADHGGYELRVRTADGFESMHDVYSDLPSPGAKREETRMAERTQCPRCGRRLIHKRDGIFRWKACPASKACGWTVFVHGQDPRDKAAQ